MLGRWRAGYVVGEERPEARARLDPRVPFLRRLVVLPRDVAEIVEARQVRRRGDVRDRELVAAEPAPPESKPAEPLSSATFGGLKLRSLGPAVTSGRVVGIQSGAALALTSTFSSMTSSWFKSAIASRRSLPSWLSAR